MSLQHPRLPAMAEPTAAIVASNRQLNDLQELTRLRQKGELSQEEFDYFRQYLLSTSNQAGEACSHENTPSTQAPAETTLADALAPLGAPHDNCLSMFADRPPKEAVNLQK